MPIALPEAVGRVPVYLRTLAAFLLGAFLTSPAPAVAAVPVLVVDGKGFGHGVGLAQDGAFWMGKAGASTTQILGHFYPGTKLGGASGTVRVPVLTGSAVAVVGFPNGGEVRDGRDNNSASGFPASVPRGGRVRIHYDGGRYHVEPEPGTDLRPATSSSGQTAAASGTSESPPPADPATASQPSESTTTTSTTAPAPPPTSPPSGPPPTPPPSPPPSSTTSTTSPPSTTSTTEPPRGLSSTRPLWAVPASGGLLEVVAKGRRYRGLLEATVAGGALRLVNELDVEPYLKGMGEVRDPSWPPAALRAQAIVARTYALRAMAVGGEICPDQRCQVYLGADAEYPAMNRAVADTGGQVVVFGRSLASTVYSANGGGFSASREEGFGTTGAGFPYLRAAPYTTSNPLPWTVRVGLADVAARFGYAGELSGVRISRAGPSGRALEIVLEGLGGAKPVSGIAFDAGLGLRSTLFALRIELAEAAPPPPAGEALLQAPPEQAGALAASTPSVTVEDRLDLPPTVAISPLEATPDSPLPRAPGGGRDRSGLVALAVYVLGLGAGVAAVGTRGFGRRSAGHQFKT